MMINRDFWFNTFLIAFLTGVGCWYRQYFDSLMFYLLVMAVVFWLFWHRALLKGLQTGLLPAIVLAGLLAGCWRAALDSPTLLLPGTAPAQMVGRVTALPEKKGKYQEVVLQVRVAAGQAEMLAVFPALERIEYGALLLFGGRVIEGTDMDERLKSTLFRRRMAAYLADAFVLKRLGDINPFDVPGLIYRLRGILLDALGATMPEPAASLVSGVLIGERGNIPVPVSRDFQTTGLTHILAISGFNITIIINLIILFTAAWTRRRRFLFCLLVIVWFVILAGAGASVVRAAVMGLLMLLAKTVGRRVQVLKVVLASAFLMVFFDPRLLNLDLSFQLSVMATLSLVIFSRSLEMSGSRKWQEFLWEGLSTTLAAQVLTLPLMFYNFGRVSLISPLANLLIGPFIPVLMMLGAAHLLLALTVAPLAVLFSGLCALLVNVMLTLIAFLAAVPLAQVEIGQGQLVLVVVYYALIYFIFRKRRPGKS